MFFGFSPILIRDRVMDAQLGKGYADLNLAAPLAWLRHWHYLGIVVEGDNFSNIVRLKPLRNGSRPAG